MQFFVVCFGTQEPRGLFLRDNAYLAMMCFQKVYFFLLIAGVVAAFCVAGESAEFLLRSEVFF